MGRVWTRPNRRDPKTLQVEICDLCGRPVGAADRTLATAEGLVGRFICSDHGDLGTNPSANDLGWPGNATEPPLQIDPHSGDNWCFDEWDF